MSSGVAFAKPVKELIPFDRVFLVEGEVTGKKAENATTDSARIKIVRVFGGVQKLVGTTFEVLAPPAITNFPSAYIRKTDLGEHGIWSVVIRDGAVVPTPYPVYGRSWSVMSADQGYNEAVERAKIIETLASANNDESRIGISKRIASDAKSRQRDWAVKFLNEAKE